MDAMSPLDERRRIFGSLYVRLTKTICKRLEEAGASYVFAAEVAVASVVTDRVIRDLESICELQSERSPAIADGHRVRSAE